MTEYGKSHWTSGFMLPALLYCAIVQYKVQYDDGSSMSKVATHILNIILTKHNIRLGPFSISFSLLPSTTAHTSIFQDLISSHEHFLSWTLSWEIIIMWVNFAAPDKQRLDQNISCVWAHLSTVDSQCVTEAFFPVEPRLILLSFFQPRDYLLELLFCFLCFFFLLLSGLAHRAEGKSL